MSGTSTNGKASAKKFAGRAVRGYQTSYLDRYLFHPALRDGRFQLRDVPAMIQDNAVSIGLLTIFGPLFSAQHEVLTPKGQDPSIKRFIENTLYRFWHHDLGKVLEQYVPYGTAVGEVLYEQDPDTGLWRYCGLDDFNILYGVQAFRRGRHLSRVKVSGGPMMMPILTEETNQPGEVATNELRAPKLFWCAHRTTCGQIYGRSTMEASWSPWGEKVFSHGAVSIRKLWCFANAFRGCWVRYPVGQTMWNGQMTDNQDIARQIAENAMTGAVGAIPSGTDEQGKPLWEIVDPQQHGDIKGLIDYPTSLNREIWQGMGVLDEVIAAPDVGAALAGHQGPLSGPMKIFLDIENMRVREITTAFDVGPSGYTTRNETSGGVIRPLVLENFGPKAKYEIRPLSLIPNMSKEPGAGGSPQSAPAAATQGAPPGGGGGMPPGPPPSPKPPQAPGMKLSQAEPVAAELPDEDVAKILDGDDTSLSAGLFDEESHPREDSGRFTYKPIDAAHVQKAQKAFRAGKLSVHHSESPITSDASGERIHHHVTLESGQRVHPDELHRLRVEDGETVLDTDEKLTIHEPSGRSRAKSFGEALHKVGAFLGKPHDPVTIESAHGYSATRPRSEWNAMKGVPPEAGPRTRDELREQGYIDMHASSDLHKYGYQTRYWFNPKTKDTRIEYIKRVPGKVGTKDPADTTVVGNYAEQAAFHRKIGANVVPPGEAYDDAGDASQSWLYQREKDEDREPSFSTWYDSEGHEHTGRRVEHEGGATEATPEETESFFSGEQMGHQGRLQFSGAVQEIICPECMSTDTYRVQIGDDNAACSDCENVFSVDEDVALSAGWDPAKHPHGEHGHWASKGEGEVVLPVAVRVEDMPEAIPIAVIAPPPAEVAAPAPTPAEQPGLMEDVWKSLSESLDSLFGSEPAPEAPDLALLQYQSYLSTVADLDAEFGTLGVEDWRTTDLSKDLSIRSAAWKSPPYLAHLYHQFDQAGHFATKDDDRHLAHQKLHEIGEVMRDLKQAQPKRRPAPEPTAPPKKPAHFGKKGAAKINIQAAAEHLALGGTVHTAVDHLMRFGGLKKATARGYVRKAVKLAADEVNGKILRLQNAITQAYAASPLR